jgi:Fur family transcriptional regulator, peroxide stress response regulator
MMIKKRIDHLTQFETACRSAGLKRTHQRMEIFTELARASDHPSPETLYRRLTPRIPAMSLDTIYRTLRTLERSGLARKVETFQSQVRFEAIQPPHHHLICRECQEISDFPWASFDTVQLPKAVDSWGIVERKSVVLTGICSKCRKTAGGKKSERAR